MLIAEEVAKHKEAHFFFRFIYACKLLLDLVLLAAFLSGMYLMVEDMHTTYYEEPEEEPSYFPVVITCVAFGILVVGAAVTCEIVLLKMQCY